MKSSTNTRCYGFSASLLALLSTVFLAACATKGTGVGATSTQPGLGAPAMMQTSLGKLAVWDMGPKNTETAVVLWPSIFTDHVMYAALANQWRTTRRVILIDGPGHGASEGPTDKTFSMQACAVAMKEILDGKSITRAVVGGTSWGGLVGAEFALLYPKNTEGLIMMNTPFLTTPGGPSFGEKFITWGAGTLLHTQLFSSGVARSFFLPATRDAGGAVMSHFHAGLHRSDPKALSIAIRSVLIEREPLIDRLQQIQTPTLVIAGLQDDMYPMEMQTEAAKKMKQSTFEIVDSKHISIVDKPTEVAMKMDAFLRTLQKPQK